jgi:hypothetical protein
MPRFLCRDGARSKTLAFRESAPRAGEGTPHRSKDEIEGSRVIPSGDQEPLESRASRRFDPAADSPSCRSAATAGRAPSGRKNRLSRRLFHSYPAAAIRRLTSRNKSTQS